MYLYALIALLKEFHCNIYMVHVYSFIHIYIFILVLHLVLVEAAVKNLPCDYELLVTGKWPLRVKQQDNSTVDDKKYKMSAEPRGIGVIINNRKFDGNPEPRLGTDVDATALVKLFTYLGFLTKCYKDLKADDMRKILKEVADLDHKNYDCLLVAVLTHGGVEILPAEVFKSSYASLEVLRGTDHKSIQVSELVTFFTGSHEHSLNEKPKIFFLQACRGKATDLGVTAGADDTIEEGSAG